MEKKKFSIPFKSFLKENIVKLQPRARIIFLGGSKFSDDLKSLLDVSATKFRPWTLFQQIRKTW
jgi:hypothetical protein